MADFNAFAGQEVASGVRPNGPVIAFEQVANRNYLANMDMINGLVPKLSKVLIRETRIRGNPLESMFKKGSLPYGVGMEQAEFMDGVPNKKTDGTCIPNGKGSLASQIDLINFAWNLQIRIKDREVNKAVLTPEEAGSYVAQAMRLPEKTRAQARYMAMRQLVSDVIDGTRTVTSTTSSDGTGTTVTYNPSITGYVASGGLIDSDVVISPLAEGSRPTISVDDTIAILDDLLNAVTEMSDETTTYSKLGINTLLLDKPYIVMEAKTLNAMDQAIMSGASQRLPTRTAREYVRTFATLVELPGAFAALPDNATYDDSRLAAVVLDKDALTEQIAWEAVESGRCPNEFATGYVYAGESLMSIWRGAPAAALLVKKSGA